MPMGIRDYLRECGREEEHGGNSVAIHVDRERICDAELACALGCSEEQAAEWRELVPNLDAQLLNAGDIFPRPWRIKMLVAAIRDVIGEPEE
jgi:hypothetical protein